MVFASFPPTYERVKMAYPDEELTLNEKIEIARKCSEILERLRNNEKVYHNIISELILHSVGYDNYPDFCNLVERQLDKEEIPF